MHNRFNSQVLIEYLNLYTVYREKDNGTAIGWARGLADATGLSNVKIKIDEILKFVTSEINAAKDFPSRYKLITTVREQAEIARKLLKVNDTSVSCFTLHGLAGLIILQLLKTGPELSEKIASLTAEIEYLDLEKKRLMNEQQGKGIEQINKKKDQCIKELAYLGDPFYCDEAMRLGLIELKKPHASELAKIHCQSTGNYEIPLCLQPNFCKWYYEYKFQNESKISFEEFVIVASLDEEEGQKNEVLRKKEDDKVIQLAQMHREKRSQQDSKRSGSGSSENLHASPTSDYQAAPPLFGIEAGSPTLFFSHERPAETNQGEIENTHQPNHTY